MKRSVNEYDEGRGGSGKVFKALENNAGPALLAGSGAAGYADYKLTKRREQDKSEADSEIKRESRGVKKPANFDAIEEAKQEAKDSADAKKQDKAYNESLTTENKAKGGMTAKFMSFSKTGKPAGMKKVTKMASGGTASSRADGCAAKGKTRGKMV
jgi:hypothetical protein